MIANVYAAIPHDFTGKIVTVEGDTNQGLPCFNIVGMANKTITESRERVRSAIANSNLNFPKKKVTINLAPAELEKDGTHLDLPIALAILVLSGQLLSSDLVGRLFVGELSLNGTTKPIRGIINTIEVAKTSGFQEIFVPIDNLPIARLIPDITIIGVSNLKELILHLKGIKCIQSKNSVQNTSYPCLSTVVKNNSSDIPNQNPSVVKNNYTDITLDSIRGQNLAKRALTIAVAGQHNILFCGPPGSGKTLLAHAAANLLPPLTPNEYVEVAKINSLSQSSLPNISLARPFRCPHHTASYAAIMGGGPHIIPGEISLAHRGVLFLDELPEFSRSVIESLRQPLESNSITIARAKHHATYPANFTLIATMNPCPCGYLHDPDHDCTCSTTQINNYQKRISGPILDRFDMIISVPPVSTEVLSLSYSKNVKNTKTDITSEHMLAKSKIRLALDAQRKRYHDTLLANGKLSPNSIISLLRITPSTEKFLQTAADKLHLSTRGYFKVLKVACTIADLENSSQITINHLSEALSFRYRP